MECSKDVTTLKKVSLWWDSHEAGFGDRVNEVEEPGILD